MIMLCCYSLDGLFLAFLISICMGLKVALKETRCIIYGFEDVFLSYERERHFVGGLM